MQVPGSSRSVVVVIHTDTVHTCIVFVFIISSVGKMCVFAFIIFLCKIEIFVGGKE